MSNCSCNHTRMSCARCTAIAADVCKVCERFIASTDNEFCHVHVVRCAHEWFCNDCGESLTECARCLRPGIYPDIPDKHHDIYCPACIDEIEKTIGLDLATWRAMDPDLRGLMTAMSMNDLSDDRRARLGKRRGDA